MPGERREEPGRIELQQRATLTNSDGYVFEIIIKDLSRAGFRIEHGGEDLEVGETVTITSMRGALAAGQIKWATDTGAGGVFVDFPEVPD